MIYFKIISYQLLDDKQFTNLLKNVYEILSCQRTNNIPSVNIVGNKEIISLRTFLNTFTYLFNVNVFNLKLVRKQFN